MDLFSVILLAAIEGVTEFIPVSSTGHMLIAEHFLGLNENKTSEVFIIFIQSGAILAAVAVYFDKFIRLIPSKKNISTVIYSRNFPSYAHILCAIVPVMLVGFFFYSIVRELLFNVYTVSFALIVGGFLMILAEKVATPVTETLEEISIKQSLLIGISQCLSLIPGMSRSASCIIGALFAGVKTEPAVNFSFIIAVPVMFAATAYDMLKNYSYLSTDDFVTFALGFVLSFLFAIVSIKLFLRLLTGVKLIPFGIYRIIIGVLILLVTVSG